MPDQLRPEDPQVIGPYRLTGRLGQGGMGDVFLGRSAGGRLVAVKVIRAELAVDPEFRARFRNEVDAARQVNGLYTPPVADADVDGVTPWLATAYVPGPSLAAAVEVHGPLPARSVLALTAGLAEGIGAVHAADLVHRDIKPSNVLLAADGPRVIDFGIARGAHFTVMTLAGRVIGSPEFMSPEQASGRTVGPPSDMFSLGAVLTYAVTGQPPFYGGMTTTILERIVSDTPDLSRVPAELRSLIDWCMQKDPERRPTPQQLLSRVGEAPMWDSWLPEPLLAGIPGRPGTAAPGPNQGPGSRSRLHDTRTTVTPVPSLKAREDAGPGQGDGTARKDTTQPNRPERGKRRARIALPAALVVLAGTGVGLWLAFGDQRHPGSPDAGSSTMSGSTVASPYTFTLIGVSEEPCSADLSTVPGRAGSFAFTDKAKTTMRVYWLNYSGQRKLLVTLKPGETRHIKGNIGDAWQVADARGCVADFSSSQSGRITMASPAGA